uniref:Uncharacterized protein n=1 Tax=Myotis myotis TaxID=51298 RepID=A0A7J7Z5N8_MYOMY|nr:hypothetical protein mMyoMyo1_010767 [Myotis myotis]
MPGGGRDASSTLWWSLGTASPRAPALGGPSGPGQALGDPRGPAPIPRGRFFAPVRQARVHSWIRTDAHVSPSSHATQTRLPIPVRPPPPPRPAGEKVSLWVGLGRLSVSHCPGALSWGSGGLSSNMTLLRPHPARDLREVTFSAPQFSHL